MFFQVRKNKLFMNNAKKHKTESQNGAYSSNVFSAIAKGI